MNPSTQILARIKLRETQRQRDRLNQLYDEIEQRTAAAATPLDRLRALHEGLRGVTFARRALHPDVANLDVLYLADELGSAPPALVAERTALLEREVAQGRLRAEFTYAFGRILSEWTGPAPETSLPPVEGMADPTELLWQDPPALDLAWIEEAFTGLEPYLGQVREKISHFGTGAAFAPVQQNEVLVALGRLTRDPNALPAFRQLAGEVRASTQQVHEYAGVLTILLENLDEWDWPAEGFPLRRVWTRVKYRPYLDEDLITALFLQVVGLRWGTALKPLLAWQNLKAGDRPLFAEEPHTSPTHRIAVHRLEAQTSRFMAAIPSLESDDETEAGYSADAMLAVLSTVQAEIHLARALARDRPALIVQADLTDFYPSMAHALLTDVLTRLGVPERWLAFFRRFFAAPVATEGQAGPRRLRRGLPLEHLLADVVAECLLFVLDVRVYQASGVQVVRVVDDFWLIGDADPARRAWAEVQAFCRATGLQINADKSGAVSIGPGGNTKGLPPGHPRWGMLRLQEDGTWQVDELAFSRMEATLRAHLGEAPSVLELVSCYNGYGHYILGKLGLGLGLGGDHLRRMAARLTLLHDNLFGPGHGLVVEVRRRLADSFTDARLKERGVPEALIYWPITAGGLALLHPLLQVATYLRGRPREGAVRPPTQVDVVNHFLRGSSKRPLSPEESASWPAGPATRGPRRAELRRLLDARGEESAITPTQAEIDDLVAGLWFRYYSEVVAVIDQEPPAPMPAMEILVNDFISRGSEVSGRMQGGLTAYWRWVVYSYGPALLAALGTFRFLMTELVPLQLILENRRSVRWELEPDRRNSSPVRTTGDDIPF